MLTGERAREIGREREESEQERARKRGTDIPTVYLRLASASGAADGSRPIRYKFHALRASRSPTISLSSPYFNVNGCCPFIHIPPKNFRPLSTAGGNIRELNGEKAAFWCVEGGRSSNSTTRSLHLTMVKCQRMILPFFSLPRFWQNNSRQSVRGSLSVYSLGVENFKSD